VKTLVDLKRYLHRGIIIKCVYSRWYQGNVGKLREVTKAQSNGVFLTDPEGLRANFDRQRGMGSFLKFPPASNVEVDNNGFKIYEKGKLIFEYRFIN